MIENIGKPPKTEARVYSRCPRAGHAVYTDKILVLVLSNLLLHFMIYNDCMVIVSGARPRGSLDLFDLQSAVATRNAKTIDRSSLNIRGYVQGIADGRLIQAQNTSITLLIRLQDHADQRMHHVATMQFSLQPDFAQCGIQEAVGGCSCATCL